MKLVEGTPLTSCSTSILSKEPFAKKTSGIFRSIFVKSFPTPLYYKGVWGEMMTCFIFSDSFDNFSVGLLPKVLLFVALFDLAGVQSTASAGAMVGLHSWLDIMW